MIPHVTYNPTNGTIYLYTSPDALPPATFEMDPEQARELIAMLVGSIVGIEGSVNRIALLFKELLAREDVVPGIDHEALALALGADQGADLLAVARQTALVTDGVRAWKAAEDAYDANRAKRTAFDRLTMLDTIRFVKAGLDVEAGRLERLLGKQEERGDPHT